MTSFLNGFFLWKLREAVMQEHQVQIGVRRELAAARCTYRDPRAAATVAQWEVSHNS